MAKLALAERALPRSIDDRNLTRHTYVEGLADQIDARIPAHAASFTQILALLPTRLSQ